MSKFPDDRSLIDLIKTFLCKYNDCLSSTCAKNMQLLFPESPENYLSPHTTLRVVHVRFIFQIRQKLAKNGKVEPFCSDFIVMDFATKLMISEVLLMR